MLAVEGMRAWARVLLFLLFTFFLVTGFMDLDWMLVSYRYSEWHRSVEYWEFCPFLKVNWWLAYVFCLMRIVLGVGYFTYVMVKCRIYGEGN